MRGQPVCPPHYRWQFRTKLELAAAQLRDFADARSLLARLKPLTAPTARAASAVELLGMEVDLLAGVLPPSAAT